MRVAILVGGWCAFVVYAYPGLMSTDSVDQLLQARTGPIHDWYPPIMAWMWRYLDRIVAGPFLMLVVQSVAFLLGVDRMLQRAMSPRAAALAAVAILLFPPVLAPMAVIWKDSQMAGFLIAGAAMVAEPSRRWKLAGCAVLVLATAERYNAFAATLPLFVLGFAGVLTGRAWKRYGLALGAWLAVTGIAFGITAALVEEHRYPWHNSVALHDLAGTLRGVPDLDDAEAARELAGVPLAQPDHVVSRIRRGYKPTAWWYLSHGDARVFDPPATEDQRAAVASAWWTVTRAHPGAYLLHRWHVFKAVLGLAKEPPAGAVWDGFTEAPYQMDMIDHHPHYTPVQRAWLDAVKACAPTPMFTPYVYLLIALLLLPFARREPDVLALLYSGLANELGLLVVAPSSDFRYSHWMIAMTTLAAVMLFARRYVAGRAQVPELRRVPARDVFRPMTWQVRVVSWLQRTRDSAVQKLQRARADRRSLALGVTLFVAAAVAFRWAHSAAAYWGIDDAAITYAASFELADHGSLAPYLGGTPVESYSNPLLFFVVAGLRLFGAFDPVTTHLVLEMLVFALMVTMVWSLLRAHTGELAAVVGAVAFAALELVTPATWIWYGSGLENVWVSAGLVALLWICARTARGVALAPAWGAVAFLVAITRPEAPVYVAAFYGALLVFSRAAELPRKTHAGRVASALAVTAVLYLAFLCWRRIGYGDWLPNTYYAKLHGKRELAKNLREYVVGGILPYCRAGLFASSVLALLVVPKIERLALAILVFVVASLALPITAGADWMGEHRFATSFLAMCHLSYGALVAVCASGLTQMPRRTWRLAQVLAIVAVLAVPALLAYDPLAIRDDIALNEVTIGRVAQLQGGQRWEHQMRLGMPYAVVLMPDAGGSLLVGGMQLVDNGYLTDFQMARIGRNYQRAADMRVLNQYEHAERRPDLVDDNRNFPLDHSYLGTRYLAGEGRHAARRDLVEVAQLDAGARPLFDDGHVRVYLSDETVRTAAPGALVRCELIVAWTDVVPDATTLIRGSLAGDRDELSLRPYEPVPNRIERRALLLGAPDHPGSFDVTIEIVRAGKPVFSGRAFTLDVTDDEHAHARAASEIVHDAVPDRAARRIAWLGEQLVPRLSMTAFRAVMADLELRHEEHPAEAGAEVLQLRWTARLATREHLPEAIRAAERVAAQGLFGTCPAADRARLPGRVLCLGRVVDRLRRLGYLDALSLAPEIARELHDARPHVDEMTSPQRYQALVGLTLAIPSDIGLQRALLFARRQLSVAGVYPEL